MRIFKIIVVVLVLAIFAQAVNYVRASFARTVQHCQQHSQELTDVR